MPFLWTERWQLACAEPKICKVVSHHSNSLTNWLRIKSNITYCIFSRSSFLVNHAIWSADEWSRFSSYGPLNRTKESNEVSLEAKQVTCILAILRMRNLLASTVKFFYEETCGEIRIFAIKAAILTRLSTWFAVPLQFQENGLVYTFLTTNGGNKHFLSAAKRENDSRKSGVRKDSCVYKINMRSKSCFTRGCILLFCVVSSAEKLEVVRNQCSCIFRCQKLCW